MWYQRSKYGKGDRTVILPRGDTVATGFSILAYDMVFLYASPQIVT